MKRTIDGWAKCGMWFANAFYNERTNVAILNTWVRIYYATLTDSEFAKFKAAAIGGNFDGMYAIMQNKSVDIS